MRKIFLLAIFIAQTTFAQDFKFGKVSKEELQETSYALDPSANAVVLYKNQITYFSFNTASSELVTEIQMRVKIYNKEGFDKATDQIDLFKNRSTKDVVSGLKAYTFNLVDGKVEKTSLSKDQIFKTEINYNYDQVKFTMPNVKEGSVIEYKYKITSPFIWNIDEFVFQYDIPIKKLEAEIRTPEGLNFKETKKGFVSFWGKTGKSYNETNAIVYKLDNVPALKEERYVDNIENYRAGVMFELRSIQIPGVINRHYASTWSDVAKTIGNEDDYENKLDKSGSFNDELDGLLAGKTEPLDKMKTVFQYVKDNLTWNDMDGKYFYYGIRKALKEKKGNAADINLTLVAMLRYAGLNANPLVISTKENILPIFPTVDRLNYVVAHVKHGEKTYFLDATNEFSDINVMPIKDYNWKGILIDNNNMVWNSININQPELAIEQCMLNGELSEDGVFTGGVRARYTKHKAFQFRESFKNKDIDVYVANKEKALKNIEISNYEAKNADVSEGYVAEAYNVLFEEAASSVGDKLYLSPLMFLGLEENPFKLDERKFPIDFGFPFQEKYNVSIKLPEGYVAETTPAPIYVKIPDNLGHFKYNVKIGASAIQLLVDFEINNAVVGADKYLFLKQFFNEMIKKEAEQIVLKKA
ncbi:DUF3857 domain-containing protein [Neotamlana laminarinivorans]|uniref:DUF3857 domain-containing protein n=1 Tax=Neotamlana laminarinivorans TaxID=2883124 RepID=A0A9X1L1F6_9FLAO|nr:transglutaminase domain-containing protein [Tamlana laminarinivorans]MCB4798630.1 DUF3857 domain-containing protein [Tamlana laminarinivorans]